MLSNNNKYWLNNCNNKIVHLCLKASQRLFIKQSECTHAWRVPKDGYERVDPGVVDSGVVGIGETVYSGVDIVNSGHQMLLTSNNY